MSKPVNCINGAISHAENIRASIAFTRSRIERESLEKAFSTPDGSRKNFIDQKAQWCKFDAVPYAHFHCRNSFPGGGAWPRRMPHELSTFTTRRQVVVVKIVFLSTNLYCNFPFDFLALSRVLHAHRIIARPDLLVLVRRLPLELVCGVVSIVVGV